MSRLMWLFLIPFLASVIAFALPFVSAKKLKRLAIGMSLIPLAILLTGYTNWIGERVTHSWLPALSIDFDLGVDSLSLLFLYLTAVIVPVSLLAAQDEIVFPNVFYGLVLLLQALFIGFFTARNLALFTVFWEAMLVPIYFLITTWGGSHRQAAALKFLIYMMLGSTLMVAAILALYLNAGAANGVSTFNFDRLAGLAETVPHAAWLFAIFMLAFAVKTPLFPFHAWLSDAYYYAPTTGTILLSAILSKAGIYGILRVGIGLFPLLMREWSPWLLGLAVAGVFYGAFAAWMQQDFKRLIAYSSLSHVNFILAGLFVWDQTAHTGAILQALNHGITIAGLFLVASWLQDRIGLTAIGPVTGVAKFFPQLCWLTLIFVLSSFALPGTNNFVGEFLILFGLFGKNPWLTSFLGLIIVFSVVYMLRWMQKVYFGIPSELSKETWVDIKDKQLWIALPLVVLIFWIGIYPAPLLRQAESAAAKQTSMNNREASR